LAPVKYCPQIIVAGKTSRNSKTTVLFTVPIIVMVFVSLPVIESVNTFDVKVGFADLIMAMIV